MSENQKLDNRVAIVVLHRQGLNISQIAKQLNVMRGTVRRWIKQYEEEGSVTDQTDPPRKNKKQGAKNSSVTQVPQTANATKSSLTKTNNKTTRTARSNKRTDVPTSDVLSGTDDHLRKVTEKSKSSENKNTSFTTEDEVNYNNKRKKKQIDDVKLPQAEEIIASVYKFLLAEYEFLKYNIGGNCDLSPLSNVMQRTADACDVYKDTVKRIVYKQRLQASRKLVGPAKRAKLRKRVPRVRSLAEEESSCDESEKEEEVIQLDDSHSSHSEESDEYKFKIEAPSDECEFKIEAPSMDVDDNDIQSSEDEQVTSPRVKTEPDDEQVTSPRVKTEPDDDHSHSEESDECEIEAPSMDVDDNETHYKDPLNTLKVEVKNETTDIGNPLSPDPLNIKLIEGETDNGDVDNLQSNSDVIPVTSLAPVKSEPDYCTHRRLQQGGSLIKSIQVEIMDDEQDKKPEIKKHTIQVPLAEVEKNIEEKHKELKRKRNCERQRANYQRQKDLKKNEEKIINKKVSKTNAERQRKRRKLCSNEENVVQDRAVENIENVTLQENQFHSQQLHIYEQRNECITPEVILRNVQPTIRDSSRSHFPARNGFKRARCKWCSMKKVVSATVWKCDTCNVNLCILGCFRDFHLSL